MLPTPFPAVRYRFKFTVETPVRLPEYAGSALRGAFGAALRRTACMTREKDCKPCPLYRTCPYPAIFETPAPESHTLQKFSQIPNPYIVEPPPWGERLYQPGETLTFHLVLIGPAMQQLPLIIHAWQRAFRHGIGNGTANLHAVSVIDDQERADKIFDPHEERIQPHATGITLPQTTAPNTVTLTLQTPMRLQNNGKPIRAPALETRDLLVNLLRRTALISEFHAGVRLDDNYHELAQAAARIESEKDLHWRDWKRYSSRQKQEMTLGGVTGQWILRGDLTPFMPMLHLGQWLHIGKNASFGLGQYRLSPCDD